jgi:hypothetical protein
MVFASSLGSIVDPEGDCGSGFSGQAACVDAAAVTGPGSAVYCHPVSG